MSSKKTYRQISLQEKLLRECDVMLKHATSKGLAMPADLLSDFTRIQARYPEIAPLRMRHRDFLSSNDLQFTIQDVDALSRIHQALVQVVAPATPFTLLLIQTDSETQSSAVQALGAVPLMRRLLILAIICLLLLIIFAFFPNMYFGNTAELSDLDGKIEKAMTVFFWLAAAGLGGSFSAIFKAKAYVSNYTFDPSYESTYWAELVLGLIAGFILAAFVPVNFEIEGVRVGKMTLALLGGYSSNAVYEILNRVIGALTYVVKPDSAKIAEIEVKAVKASVKQEITSRKQLLANDLVAMQTDLILGRLKPNQVGDRLKGIVTNLVTGEEKGYVSPNRPVAAAIEDSSAADLAKFDIPHDLNPQTIDPATVEHFHEDELNNATEEEYIKRI